MTPLPAPSIPLTRADRWKRHFRRSLRLVAYSILGFVIMLAWLQRSLIYHPTRDASLKGACSLLAMDVQVTTHDKLVLNGWLVLSDSPETIAASDLAAVGRRGRFLAILFPGNGGHRGMREDVLRALCAAGADAMIFDHRGYGDNPGSPTEALLVQDARTIWDFATKTLAVAPDRIVIYGESLGGGIATRLAANLCSAGIVPAGLVIQSSFNSLVAAGGHHFPFLPVSLLLMDRFNSADVIPKVTCPLLQLHGEQDEIVPVALGKTLFAAAPAKSLSGIEKTLVLLPATNHNDVFGPDVNLVMDALTAFFEKLKSWTGS